MQIKSFIKRVRDRLFTDFVRRDDLDRLYDQIAGLWQIQNAMNGATVLRPMRRWAISPDTMAWILADLQERRAPAVIEFGSGQSTIILAAALKHRGGRLLSVEHDLKYCETIRRQLEACGLAKQVEFIHCPLVESGSPTIRSYDGAALPQVAVDVALVDGPPYTNGPLTRLPPLRWSASHLQPGGAIFLDDTRRSSEQECLARLMAEHPGLRLTERTAEKGLVELRLG